MRTQHESGPDIVTAATSDPISLEEAKNYCLVDGVNDNDMIEGFIAGATDYVQRMVGQQFLTTTLIQTWDYFYPWQAIDFSRGQTWDRTKWELKLLRRPVQSVSWVKYYDIDGTLQTLSTANYWTALRSKPPRIMPIASFPWPDTQWGRPEAVQVQYVAGFTSADNVPRALRTAVLSLVKHWYDTRSPVIATGAVPQNVPHSLNDLMNLYDDTSYC